MQLIKEYLEFTSTRHLGREKSLMDRQGRMKQLNLTLKYGEKIITNTCGITRGVFKYVETYELLHEQMAVLRFSHTGKGHTKANLPNADK